MPNTDAGTLSISLRNPPSTPLQVTNDGVGRLEAYLLAQPEVVTIQSVIGSSPNGVGGSFSGGNTANLVVQLVSVKERPSIFALIPKYRSRMLSLLRDQPSAQVFVSAGGGFGPSGTSLQLSIVAPNFSTLFTWNAIISVP